MNHQRRHKHSPDQNVGFVRGSQEVVHLLQDSLFFLIFFKTFSKYHEMEMCTWAILSFRISTELTSLLRRQLPTVG